MLSSQTNDPNKPKEETKLLTGLNNRLEELAVQDFLIIYNYERSKKTAFYLWLFLGLFGIHHIYLRRYLHFLLCILWLWIIYSFVFLEYYLACIAGPYILVWLIDGCRLGYLLDVANNGVVPIEKKVNPWSVYDIYLFWIPPFGLGGLHHFYTGYYWRFLSYLFSLGFIGIGWLLDLFLIPCYYYPKLKQSFLDKINKKDPVEKHQKTHQQAWMCWFPFGGWLGFHHFYCGDITLGICYFLTLGGWLVGWLIDLFLIPHYYRRFDENIEKQFEEWKKQNDVGNASATDNARKFQPSYPFIFKKTHYHSYLTWLSSLGFLGLHHLYLHNWVMFAGHILTVGGCGIMWIVDLFLMPSFIKYSNEKLGFSENISIKNNANNNNNVSINNDNNLQNVNQANQNISTVENENSTEMQVVDISNDNNNNNNNNNNNTAIMVNSERNENNQIRQIQYNHEIEYQRALYTTYLFWTPLMGCIGVYYIYLSQYKQFFIRLFTLNFLLIGWIIDAFRIPRLVGEKIKNEEAKKNNNQNEHLIH